MFIFQLQMATTRKHIFITGSVGVGKTSTINEALSQSQSLGVNVFYVKEYIDNDPYGVNKYDDWTNNRMSLFDFQMYICNEFRKQLKSPEYMLAGLVIWERHPREALMVFSQSGLSDSERERLHNAISELEEDYDIPRLMDTPKCYAINMSSLSPKFVGSIVISTFTQLILDNTDSCYFLYLFYPRNRLYAQLANIKRRGRTHEIARYDLVDNLVEINRLYDEFVLRYLNAVNFSIN